MKLTLSVNFLEILVLVSREIIKEMLSMGTAHDGVLVVLHKINNLKKGGCDFLIDWKISSRFILTQIPYKNNSLCDVGSIFPKKSVKRHEKSKIIAAKNIAAKVS